MNNTHFFIKKTKNAIVGVFALFAAQVLLFGGEGVEVPPPPIPIASAGKYAPKILKIQKLLDENKIWEFYNEIRVFSKERAANWDALGRPERQEDGETTLKIANEWLFYLLVKAPWISTDEYVEKEIPDGRVVPNFDNNLKIALLELLIGQKVKSVIAGDEYLFFFEEGNRIFELLHLEYVIILLKTFDTKDVQYGKEFLVRRRKSHIPTPGLKQLSKHELSAFYEKHGRYYDPALEKHSRSLTRSHWMSGSLISLGKAKGWITKIIETFPRDGAKVQEYIKKVGCEQTDRYKVYNLTSDEMCLFLLDKYFPKTKETAYLYKGLPLGKLKSIRDKIKRIDSETLKKEDDLQDSIQNGIIIR
jgi:hypothetical protein